MAIAMRIAAAKELTVNVEIDKITLKSVLGFDGEGMMPAVESTPHANVPLWSTSDFHLPTNPWPKPDEVVN